MRVTPIPDADVVPGTARTVVGPIGDPRMAPVEVLMDHTPLGPRAAARLVLEPGDLEKLAAGEPLWLTMLGYVVPFAVSVGVRCPCGCIPAAEQPPTDGEVSP